MTHSMTTAAVAINDLVSHPANVRANSPETYETENIAHLKASIAALGVIQPLLVQKINGKFGVLAGGRRHAALVELVADKAAKGFTKKTRIECRVVPEDCDVTTALSLAENITQAPMDPIDEYEAFARMLQVDNQTVDSIAMTFGTTVAAVKGRLRFGLVHPDIRAAVRARKITLDVLKAFADHPSQDVQKEVFDAFNKSGDYLAAHTVRSALKSRGVQVSDALGQLVRADYEARGGGVACDLLEEHSVLEDNDMVAAILVEKLAAAAEAKRAEIGFAWADTMPKHDYAAFHDFGRVYPGTVEPDDSSRERVLAIEAEIEELSRKMEDEGLDDDAYNDLSDRVDQLEDEARDLLEAYDPDDLARAGVIASWNGSEIVLTVGLVRPEDKVAQPGRSVAAGGASEDASDADDIVYAASLQDDLKTERAMALGAAMAQNPEATFDLALFKIVSDVLGQGARSTYAIKLSADTQHRAHAKADEIDQTSKDQLAAAVEDADMGWADDSRSPAEQFRKFRALGADMKARLVACAVAHTTVPCFARDKRLDSLMFDLEAEIMPDIRVHWTPNAALFNRFKKASLLKILSEDLELAQEAVALASSSKKDVVEFMDKLFAEPFATLTDAQRSAVGTWCPPQMQTLGVEGADGEETVDTIAEDGLSAEAQEAA